LGLIVIFSTAYCCQKKFITTVGKAMIALQADCLQPFNEGWIITASVIFATDSAQQK